MSFGWLNPFHRPVNRPSRVTRERTAEAQQTAQTRREARAKCIPPTAAENPLDLTFTARSYLYYKAEWEHINAEWQEFEARHRGIDPRYADLNLRRIRAHDEYTAAANDLRRVIGRDERSFRVDAHVVWRDRSAVDWTHDIQTLRVERG